MVVSLTTVLVLEMPLVLLGKLPAMSDTNAVSASVGMLVRTVGRRR